MSAPATAVSAISTRLAEVMAGYGSVLVGFSGGVDSALVAVAAAVVFTASGLPFRIAFRLKKIAATTIATNPSRVIEANTQLVCEPKTSASPIHVTDELMAPE